MDKLGVDSESVVRCIQTGETGYIGRRHMEGECGGGLERVTLKEALTSFPGQCRTSERMERGVTVLCEIDATVRVVHARR